MRVGPGEKLSRRVRWASVGATTGAVAVAAHGAGGGGLPAGSTLMLLVGFSAVLVTVMAAVPVLRRGGPALVPILAVGQLGAHTTLAFGGGHHADMAAGPIGGLSPQMLAAHAVAIGVCAALIAAAERIGPRTEAALRAVVAALVVAIPVLERPRSWRPVAEVHPLVSALCRVSVPRRGPPLFV
ncbi:hypothetical protein [Rhodococcus daqingensis]|uniref:MFS transporter n=1 Tax=Rhodococcus daqingensis TaxID=2479363 RepID=A0ABW2RWC3_9NOCA